MTLEFSSTLVTTSAWSRLEPTSRKRLIRAFWLPTEVGLVAGLFEPRFWDWVLCFTVAHAVLFLGLVRWRPLAFPAQLRIAYVGWLIVGIHVPFMGWMMPVTTAGLLANLLFGYCPLARMLTLLPWNRNHDLDLRTAMRIFVTPPVAGRFSLPAA